MGQWEGLRAARLGPAPTDNWDTVHGDVAGRRNGRFESRDVDADQKRQVESVIPNY